MVLRVGHSSQPHPSAKTGTVRIWTYECAACGQTFEARKFTPCDEDGTLYCSPDVPAGGHRWCSVGGHVFVGDKCTVSHDKSVKPQNVRTCENCGKLMVGRRSDARYCSARCRVAAHRHTG